jgi:release factor glutamine methyltransferase
VPTPTIRQAITAAASQFVTDPHLRDNAARDAELLLLHTLQISRATLLAHPDRTLSPDEQVLYEQRLKRRLQHEPIQYITGRQEFYGIDLRVSPAVLIPRPETEHLVEAVLHSLLSKTPLKIADVGTGSGAIAIALAVHLPQAQVIALDISREALSLAEANAREQNVAGRIHFLQSDLLSSIDDEAGTFDAIVSNPPYIPDNHRDALHPQVRDHEPATALFAGKTGLDIYRRLIPQACKALKPDGLLALEIGHGKQPALTALLTRWRSVSFINDLQQIPRVVLARRPELPAIS